MEEVIPGHIRIATADAYCQKDVLLVLLRHLERKLIILMSLKIFLSALSTQLGTDSPTLSAEVEEPTILWMKLKTLPRFADLF